VVASPTPLAVAETRRLVAALGAAGVAVNHLVLNKVLREPSDEVGGPVDPLMGASADAAGGTGSRSHEVGNLVANPIGIPEDGGDASDVRGSAAGQGSDAAAMRAMRSGQAVAMNRLWRSAALAKGVNISQVQSRHF